FILKKLHSHIHRSTTSSDAASVHEAPPPAPPTALSSPSVAPPSPSLNPAFLRPRPANQQSRAKRLSHLFLRGRSNSDRDRAIGERERELWAHSATPSQHHYLPPASSSAPGLVKIYGDALSSGANYRSLLANIHSTARQLIQQVITRYTEREREIESDDIGKCGRRHFLFADQCPNILCTCIALQKHSPEDFLLCDVIGKPIQQADGAVQWQTECRRGVAPWECPLLLVDMWRPKDGFERRFEIQRRDEYEREEREREKERERDGENNQVRWRRSRMASGGGPEEERGHRGRNTELRRSISDMNLTLRRRQGNQANNESRRSGNTATSGGAQDRKNIVSMIATEPGQDFVLYIMAGHTHVFGRKPTFREREKDRERERKGKRPLRVDTFLSAPDLLVRHLLVRRDSAVPEQPCGQALLRPFRGGAVSHNGVVLYRETVLKSGDLIGLGSHFIFLYRDPRVTPAPPLALALPLQADGTISFGPGNMMDRQEALRKYLGSTEAVIKFQAHQADVLLQENIKEFGDKHPTQTSPEPEADLPPPSVQKLSSDLRPLMFWMANATELLNFFQVKVETMEKEWEFEAQGDPVLSADMDTCSDALAQLDDVIMHTFQQCVYHLTKTLYSLLPTLLDTNPFSSEEKEKEKAGVRDGDSHKVEGEDGEESDVPNLPPTVAGLVEVYHCSLQLTREACLSPPLTSQTFGYLFFFTNTSLLNTLLERDSLFSWARAVQIRTNLDLVLDWLQGAGLGDIASEFLKKLSNTVNFLCIPKTRLIQSSWASLQEEHGLLSPAQLHHLLTHYKLGPARAPPSCWAPPPGTDLGGDIFESFLDHPPLILPNETPSLDLTQPIPNPELQKEVARLRTFLWGLDQDEPPANQRTRL
ncbi:hypothetical protein QTP70_014000, partial [Hemibagrus guttatus]